MAAPQLFDLVKMTTPTTGTGALTLGSAVGTFRSFATAGVPNGATVRYAIADPGLAPTQREWGTGVYTASGTTLTRVLGGSSTGALLNLSGAAHIAIAPMAEDLHPYIESRADIATSVIYASTFSTPDGARWIHGTSGGPMAIQDASGQWWQIDLSQGSLVTWFGAVADNGTTNNRAAFLLADARGPFTVPVGVFGINTSTAITNEVTVLDGGQINVATGQTLTLSGGIRAGMVKIFTGVGSVAGLGISQAEWFAGDLMNTTTDAVTPLQAWLDAAVTNGLCLMGPGYFVLNGVTPLAATKGQKIIGAGSKLSSMRWSGTATNVLAFTGSVQNSGFYNISFDSTSGANIPASGDVVSIEVSALTCGDFVIGHGFNGIHCDNARSFIGNQFRISNCVNTGFWAHGTLDLFLSQFLIQAQTNWINISGASGSFTNGENVTYSPSGAIGTIAAIPSSSLLLVTKVGKITPLDTDTITGASSGTTADVDIVTQPHQLGGMRVDGHTEAFTAFGGDIIGGIYPLYTDSGTYAVGSCPAFCEFSGIYFDSGTNGVSINKSISLKFNNCFFSSRPGSGCTLDDTLAISFDDCNFVNNGAHGLVINAGAVQTTVNGGNALGNSTVTASAANGIRVKAGAGDFTICNVQGGNGIYGTQGADVFIESGASNNYVIKNISNGSGTVTDNGTGANKVVEGYAGVNRNSQWHVVQKSGVPASTSSATEAALATYTIPGGSIGANGAVRVSAYFSMPSSGNTKTMFVRLGGISGTAFLNNSATTNAGYRYIIEFHNNNSQAVQLGGPSSGAIGANGASTIVSAVNTANAQDLVISGLTNGTETLTLNSYIVEICYGV